MHYYRKAAAVFILVFTLTLPIFWEAEQEVALVEIKSLMVESKYLSTKIAENKNPDIIRAETMKLIKETAAEFAEKNNYSSVVTKHLIYKGGRDITKELAKKIDAEN